VAHELSLYWGRPVIAVGAAFNFLAGTVREAPKFFVTLHLEWFFRLISEPRRLWKRYLFGNIKFIAFTLVTIKSDLHLTRKWRQKD
jgi:N-acetylglucosaminyldiphosphoundecaprenol N-acetyl-beta-D-mannosaminyltransferase